MNYIIVGIGGTLGSLTRYILGRKISQKSRSSFPIGTFLINISGAILLGIVTSIKLNNNLYLLIADGFLGAYTTFSTFMYEGFNLFHKKENLNTVVYVIFSLALGIFGFALGAGLGKNL